jgi:HlyD family secretion protein
MKKKTALLLLLLACGGTAVWFFQSHEKQNGAALTLYGNVDIRTVNASFRVAGRLAALHADEGDAVRAGMILAEIDPGPFQNALREAEANLAAQAAQLALLEAGYRAEEIAQVRSEVAERSAAFDYAERFYKRQAALLPARAVSANQADTARTDMEQARAALQASRDKLRQFETGSRTEDIEAARAKLMQAQARLAQAELDLNDATLASPSDGVVLTRAVEPGTMLSAGGTVFTLSLTRPVWVRAYVDGGNLYRAAPGTTVSLSTDAPSAAPYRGRIGFVSPTAEFTPKNVQTPELRTGLVYRLRILVDNPDDALRQGMPVTVVFAP